jgi:DNA-binding CsgD family transcriptional regulator
VINVRNGDSAAEDVPSSAEGETDLRWSDDKAQKEQVVAAMTKDGLSTVEIGNRTGLSRNQVQYIRTTLNIRVGGRRQIEDDPERDAKIVELSEQGMSARQIGEQLGMTEWRVKRFRTVLGVRGKGSPAAVAEREQTVKTLTEQGLTCKQIGKQIGLVEHSVQAIRTRIGLRTRGTTPAQVRRLVEQIEVFGEMLNSGMASRSKLLASVDQHGRAAVTEALRALRTEVTRIINRLEEKTDGNDT